MLDSYFFVPADKERFLRKIGNLKADFFVIDMEESVSINNKMLAFRLIENLNIDKNIYVRLPIKDEVYSKEQLLFLVNKFEGRIVLPKVSDISDIEKFVEEYKLLNALNLIVLVENPQCLIHLHEILRKYSSYLHAIGFGSHDFSASMGMKHTMEHLMPYRKQLIVLSKAYNIKYIDGVDLNIRDLSDFREECKYLFDAGGDGKCLIHPDQLKEMGNIDYLTKSEYDIMLKVYAEIEKIELQQFDVLEIDGRVYEKPHLLRIKKIMGKLAH